MNWKSWKFRNVKRQFCYEIVAHNIGLQDDSEGEDFEPGEVDEEDEEVDEDGEGEFPVTSASSGFARWSVSLFEQLRIAQTNNIRQGRQTLDSC